MGVPTAQYVYIKVAGSSPPQYLLIDPSANDAIASTHTILPTSEDKWRWTLIPAQDHSGYYFMYNVGQDCYLNAKTA